MISVVFSRLLVFIERTIGSRLDFVGETFSFIN